MEGWRDWSVDVRTHNIHEHHLRETFEGRQQNLEALKINVVICDTSQESENPCVFFRLAFARTSEASPDKSRISRFGSWANALARGVKVEFI